MGTPDRRRRWRLGTAAAAAIVVAGALPAPAGLLPDLTTAPYIVQADSVLGAQGVVTSVAGILGAPLPLVNGVVASLTDPQVTTLSALPGVHVTLDGAVHTTMSAGKPGPKPPPPPPRQLDNVFRQVTGATAVSSSTGQGIGVAVIDTGIAPLADFGTRLKPGTDFTTENDPTLDSYGHGTFVAGLIAGNGASSKGTYVGEAPGANLVPVKVAGASGITSMSTVIQALKWVIDNRATSNIRVVNLSLGAEPTGPTVLNPLNQAVEATVHEGLVVVTSAGNDGDAAGTITSPGDDPLVITAGSLDDKDTTAISDDTVPVFSSRGPTTSDGWWKPDLIAPGKSVVSVMSSSSYIWKTYTTAQVGKANFVGSGTSFSAAITSGAAAILLKAKPALTPSKVKAALLTTTSVGPGTMHSPFEQGHGVLNVSRAVAEPMIDLVPDFTGIGIPVVGDVLDLVTTQAASGWASLTDGLAVPTYPLPYTGDATTPTSGFFQSKAWNSTGWDSKAWNGAAWDSKAWNTGGWQSKAWNSKAWNDSTWS